MRKLLIILVLFVFGCSLNKGNKEVVIIKGSDTMVNLSKIWAIEFMKLNPNISVQINGGGSGTGIASLLNNTVQIANVSRELNKTEIENAEKHNIFTQKHIVALDAIAIIVNKNNPVDSLDFNQLRGIFAGKIRNWKDLGGNDSKITLLGRENSSGTYEYFKAVVLYDNVKKINYDFSSSMQVLQGTSSLAEEISRNIKAIGFGSLGYFAGRRDVKILKIKTNTLHNAVNLINNGKINYKLIWEGKYPLSRYLYCYTGNIKSKSVEKYLNFIKSSQGQKLVEEMEYIPLPYKNE